MFKRTRLIGVTLAAGVVVAAVVVQMLPGRAAGSAPGTLDDGAELLPNARISLADAIGAATSAADGAVGEVDLEYWHGSLVFNVDVGDDDVKVDASTGAVLGAESDD